MYERLSPLGICLSYKNTLQLCDLLADEMKLQVVKAVKEQKQIRIVGDNLNFTTHVRDERMSKHGKMHHYFGSAILVHDLSFPNTSRVQPQIVLDAVKADLFIPDASEQQQTVNDYALMAIQVAIERIPIPRVTLPYTLTIVHRIAFCFVLHNDDCITVLVNM